MKLSFLIKSLIIASFLLPFVFSGPKLTSANTYYHYDTFNGQGLLELHNPSYKKISNFNPTGDLTLANGHLEASGYDPGYILETTLSKNLCASLDFNWSNGGSWTGIFINSTTTSWKDEIQLRNDNGITNWIYLKDRTYLSAAGQIDFDTTETQTLKTCLFDNKIMGYLNDVLFMEEPYLDEIQGYFGIAAQQGVKYIDNFKIESFINTNLLNLHLFKQTDPRWKDLVYDKGNAWSPSDPTINSWGCALTSAAMVFRYYGINKLPNKAELNPATLNAWLNRQSDGYVGNGHVNWLALSRLSKQSTKINKIKNFEALEFKKTYTDNKDLVIENLSKNLPDILEIPGHFVAAKGNDENGNILINDPYYDKTLLSEHSSELISINSFVPSKTDLSYIMLVVNPEIDLELLNSQGEEVGKAEIQDPVINPNNQSQNNNQIKILYLSKPTPDNYKIKLSSSENFDYNLKIFLYDKNGDVFTVKKFGSTNGNNILIDLPFDGQKRLYPKKVTINTLLLDIQKSFIKNDIKDLNTKIRLDLLTTKIKLQSSLNKPEESLQTLMEMEDFVYTEINSINENARKKIIYDINYLSTHL